jgi:hypothetical protein
MNRPWAIIAVVTASCLAAVFALLSIIAIGQSNYSLTPWAPYVGYPLPFVTAILSSLLVHGTCNWLRRLGLTILIPLSTVAAAWAIYLIAAFAGGFSGRLAVTIATVGFLSIPFVLVVFGWRVSRRRGVALDTNRWFSERTLAVSERKRRNRAIRRSLWIPPVAVLLVSLFLPETWALTSHFWHPRQNTVNEYVIPVPRTWILISRFDGSLHGLIARGIARDPRGYRNQFEIPLSGWTLYARPPYRLGNWAEKEIIDQRVFTIGNDSLTCVQYWPSPRLKEQSIMAIECSSPTFHSTFGGEARDVPAFFDVMSRIRPAK